MIERTDVLLAQGFRERGDREALSALIERYQTPIYSYLLRLLKNPHDAEEAAQDCFLRMMRGLAGYRPDMPFRAWLYRIALNCARTGAVRRKAGAERERLAAAARPEGAKAMTPADAAVRNEVLNFLEELPEPQREAMTLHYNQGLSHSEVASVLDVPAGTVATRIHTGLESLRARLAALGIAWAGLSLGDILSSAEAVVAPSSILPSVLSAAAPAAPALIQGGMLMAAKAKFGVTVAVAVACAAGGGMAGYAVRAARVERPPEAAGLAPLAARPLPAAAPATSRASAPGAAASRVRPAETPVPAPAVEDPRAVKARRMARLFAKLIKAFDPVHADDAQDPAAAAEFLALMMDPELQTKGLDLSKGGGVLELGDDVQFALLEELGVDLSAEQKARLERVFKEDPKRADLESGTAVDQRIAEVRDGHGAANKMLSILTPEQQEKASCLTRLYTGTGPGVLVPVASPDRAVPGLLDAWSRRLAPLNGDERLRANQAATLHASQLQTLQDDLRFRYGPDFVDRLSLQLQPNGTPPTASSAQEAKDYAAKASDAYARLLELERQTRLNLIQALPERAEEIRKAPALAYFFTTGG
jgi:RNA polymerase sigma-70 factor, ECF subfamily